MAPNNNSSPLEKQQQATWGTWEELLLACAVRRHGADSWHSVATEVRKRSSVLHVTPQSCRHKYLDLERRFSRRGGDGGGGDPCDWLDELRRLRVAELKSDLERYDLSIVSLQSKVRRLKEEREQGSGGIEKDAEESDLDGTGGGEPAKSSPESFARKPSRSVNESNSTDPKHKDPETGIDEDGKEPVEPAADGSVKTGRTGEDSYDGSTETVAKESPPGGVGDSAELGESVAESKGGGGSDVQSSVSLSTKKEDEPVEPDNEDQSPAIKRPNSQSQPFADFLHVLRSHELGHLFERRLHSQETSNYRELIRQHMDLENVGKRVEEGWYSGPNKFYRDLLLLLNNAIVFYGNKSPESLAAIELRKLVAKEIASQSPKSKSPKSDQPSKNTKPAPSPPSTSTKQGSGSGSGPVKPKISIPIAACRKRSSIVTKPSSGTEKKRELASLVDKKPVVADIKLDHQDKKPALAGNVEEAPVTKKRSRERSSSTTGGRNSNKNTSKNSDNNNRGGSVESKVVVETEKKSNNTNTSTVAGKKQSAANFLNRMKTSTSSPDQPTKNVAASKPETRKDQGSGKKGSSSSGKKQESPGKKRIGRPPKKVATPPSTSGKRNREGGEVMPKKRARK